MQSVTEWLQKYFFPFFPHLTQDLKSSTGLLFRHCQHPGQNKVLFVFVFVLFVFVFVIPPCQLPVAIIMLYNNGNKHSWVSVASSNGCLLHKHLGLAQHHLGSSTYQLELLTPLPLACCWVNSGGLSFICLFSTCFSFFIRLAQTFSYFHTYRRKDRNTQGLFMLRSLYEGGQSSSLPYSGGKTHIGGIGNI